MIPVSFDKQNMIISGGDAAIDVPAFREGNRTVTCWRLNKEDIELINNSGVLWIHVYGGTFPPMAPSAVNPFRKLLPLIVDELIADKSILVLVDGEELILVKVKEGEYGFRVTTSNDEWYHLRYQIIGDVNSLIWHQGPYSFGEKVEVIGMAEDCREYWWLIENYGLNAKTTLILKRVVPSAE